MEPIILWTEDGDERNARPLVVNHGRPGVGVFPGLRPTIAPSGRPAPVVLYPSAPMAPMAPVAAPSSPMTYVPGTGWVPAYNPAQAPATAGQAQGPLGSKLGQLATPALIQGVAMLLASFLPVPPAPTVTGSVEDDVANGITYQAALAAHAKTDEKLRAAGFLLAQFL